MSWFSLMKRVVSFRRSNKARCRPLSGASPHCVRPLLEALEDRLTPDVAPSVLIGASHTGDMFAFVGSGSTISSPFGNSDDYTFNNQATDAQGRTLIPSSYGFAFYGLASVTRYNSDRTVDTNFGVNGTATIASIAFNDTEAGDGTPLVAVDSQGRILMTVSTLDDNIEETISVLARFLPDGTPDPTFGDLIALPTEAGVGTAVPLAGDFFDPGATNAAPYSYSWTVSDGNGDVVAGLSGTVSDYTTYRNYEGSPVADIANNPGTADVPSLSFIPATAGDYTITLTVTDKYGAVGTTSTALTVTPVVFTNGVLNIYGTPASDDIALSATETDLVINENGAQYTFPLTAVSEIDIHGQGGGDNVTIDFGNLPADINLVDSGSANSLTVFGLPDAALNRITKTPGTITWTDGITTETLGYSGIDSLIVNANGNYANEVIDPGSHTTINGGRGSNTIVITATTGSGVVINGGVGANTYIVDLGSLAGPVTINNTNTGARDTLVVNGANGDNVIAVSGDQITEAAQTIMVTAPLATLAINGGSGTNVVTVESLTVPVQSLALTGNPGDTAVIAPSVTIPAVSVAGGLKATPVFSHVSMPVITDGAASTVLSGTISAGSLVPAGTVAVTVHNVTVTGPIHADGTFSVTFPTAALSAGAFSVLYSYAGDSNCTAASATAALDVTYGILVLTNLSKASQAGSTIPIQIELVTAAGVDVSSAKTVVTAIGIASVSTPNNITTVQGAGNSNPGNVFQFVGGKSAYYQFNLKTSKNLAAGAYMLDFTVTGDPIVHTVQFQVT